MVLTMAKMVDAVPLPAILCIARSSWAGATATRDGWCSATAARIVDKVGTHTIEFFRRQRTNSLTSASGSRGSAAGGVTRRAAGAVRRVATGSRSSSSRGEVTRRAAGAVALLRLVSVHVHVLSTDALHIRRVCTARSGIGGLSVSAIANQ